MADAYENTFDTEPPEEEWENLMELRESQQEKQGESRVQHLRDVAKEQLKKKVKQQIKKQLAKKAAQQAAKRGASMVVQPILTAIAAIAPWVGLILAIVFILVFVCAVIWYAGLETVCTGGANIVGGLWHGLGELTKKVPLVGGAGETILDAPEFIVDMEGDLIEFLNPLCYLLKTF